MKKPRILILSMTVGQGHNTASRAMSSYLESQGAETQTLDTYKYLNSFVGNAFDKGYTYLAKHSPTLYSIIFNSGEKVQYEENPNLKAIFPFLFAGIVKGKMSRFIEDYQPDAIICPHVFCAIIMNELRESGMVDESIPYIGVNTDFQIHPFWEFTNVDHMIVSANFLVEECRRRGMDASVVHPFGMPVEEKFYERADAAEARLSLGLKNMFTVLVTCGGMGFTDLTPIVADLDRIEEPTQVIVICGSNKKLKETLEDMEFRHEDFHIVGYTHDMCTYMDAADVVMTKPGGLSTCETLAKDKTMLLLAPLKGIEDANLAYFTNNSLGLMTNEFIKGSTLIRELRRHPEITEHMSLMRKTIFKQHPAREIGDFVLGLIRDNKEIH